MSIDFTNDGVTAAEVLVEALRECGVSFIFANLGSDHPALIEALAKERTKGEKSPAVIICPHEVSAMSAAHGYALATALPQAVFVHTDVGTANLGGTVHNAARSRVPVFVFAGLTPYTLEGELPGTRNAEVNYIQDVHGQADLVRAYVKWSYDIRTGANLKQLVFRALQLSNSSPQGPVYMTAAREVLADTVTPRHDLDHSLWNPIAPMAAPPDIVDRLIEDVAAARFPLIITSYLGRSPAAVEKLVRFAESLGIGVLESRPTNMNFPAHHPLHLGYSVEEVLGEADVILALDTDIPWINSMTSPSDDARIYFIDTDPLKEGIPLWYIPSHHFVRADSITLLDQFLFALANTQAESSPKVIERSERLKEIHQRQRHTWSQRILESPADQLTPEVVSAAIQKMIDDDAIVLNETITSSETVFRYIPRTQPGTLYANNGSSLGWSGGAALGIKLANPERMVVSLVGDGTFFFSVPSSTYWISHHYSIPFLTVIFDNGGWNATKQNLVKQYPGGLADGTDHYWVNLAQSADLAGIAKAAGGAYAATITTLDELEPTLLEALAQVKDGNSAVVSVRLAAISNQQVDRF